MVDVEINFSKQAELILKHSKNVTKAEVLDWFINKRKIFIGGGDIITYLEFLDDKK